MILAEPVRVIAELARDLEVLGRSYMVGGSVASSIHGVPRTTYDVDIVADLTMDDVDGLVDRIQERFYVDADAARTAIRRKKSFNLIHLETMLKVDVFAIRDGLAAKRAFERRQRVDLGRESLLIASPEDIIVEKLRWYRLGDEVSERQWRDALGVLATNGLDEGYLTDQAAEVGVVDLLQRLWKAL
ncbi:MAG: hypothetical protein HN348_28745 [Proteobacteria bacterium]|jgi:hypothetical protein|nr:hypothetical protein [Pseudomonadota bacterium]